MATHTLTHLGGTTDHRAALATLIAGASAGDTVIIPSNATAYSFTTPADPGDGTPYYAIDLKSGSIGSPILYTINGNLIAATSSFAGVRASFVGCVKKSYITINGSGSIDGTNIPDVGSEQLRHLFEMRGSNNITITGASGLQLLSCKGGDNMHIGPTEETIDDSDRTPCSTITIQSLYFASAKRNNVSVVSAVDLTMSRCQFTDAAGTSPQGGLVLEPEDDNRDQLTRVLIDECLSYGNASRDFLVATHSMDVGGHTQPIDVTFRNCRSRRGTRVTPRAFEVQDSIASAVTGTVKFQNCMAENLNNQALYLQMNLANLVQIVVQGGESRQCARTTTNRVITMILTGAATGSGVVFNDYSIVDHIDRSFVALTTDNTATNVRGIIRYQGPTLAQENPSLPRLNLRRAGRHPYSWKPKARRSANRGEI